MSTIDLKWEKGSLIMGLGSCDLEFVWDELVLGEDEDHLGRIDPD